jgi:topoisomerase-4 subunit B
MIYECGLLKEDITKPTDESNGLYVSFEPNIALFKDYRFHEDILVDMLRNYSYLNTGLSIRYNGMQMLSLNGLADMLHDDVKSEAIYPIIHFIGNDIEIAFTHTYRSGSTIYSYVNKHYTPFGGTHQEAFEKHFIKTMKRVYGRKKNDAILYGLVAAIAIRVDDPIFDSSTKVKLSSNIMEENGVSIDTYIGDFLEKHLYDYLCAHPDVSSTIKSTINEYK